MYCTGSKKISVGLLCVVELISSQLWIHQGKRIMQSSQIFIFELGVGCDYSIVLLMVRTTLRTEVVPPWY